MSPRDSPALLTPCCALTSANGRGAAYLRNRTRNSVVTPPVVCTTLAPWTRRQSGEPPLSPCAAPSASASRRDGSGGQAMAIRLGIYHPLAFLPREVARARIRAVWGQHPEFSATQVAACARLEHPLGMCRTWKLLRECRVAAAKRSPVHNRVGWHLDKFTAARIRIGAIWKRHPEFTAKQVIRRLGPKYAVRLPWVQKVMRECWRASANPTPKYWRIGRRAWQYWRARKG